MANNNWINWTSMVLTKGEWRQVMEMAIGFALIFLIAIFLTVDAGG